MSGIDANDDAVWLADASNSALRFFWLGPEFATAAAGSVTFCFGTSLGSTRRREIAVRILFWSMTLGQVSQPFFRAERQD